MGWLVRECSDSERERGRRKVSVREVVIIRDVSPTLSCVLLFQLLI